MSSPFLSTPSSIVDTNSVDRCQSKVIVNLPHFLPLASSFFFFLWSAPPFHYPSNMKWTPLLSAAILGAALTTAGNVRTGGGQDDGRPADLQPTAARGGAGGSTGRHGHQHLHSSHTGHQNHMSSAFPMIPSSTLSEGGGPPQQTGGVTMNNIAERRFRGGQQHQGGHGGSHRRGSTAAGGGRGGGGQDRSSVSATVHQTVTRVSQVHVPSTLTKMVSANDQ